MDGQKHWDWRARSIGGGLWPSFLSASFASVVFFALIDPEILLHALIISLEVSRIAVYSLGFFFFWLISLLSSILTTWLIRTERKRAEFPSG